MISDNKASQHPGIHTATTRKMVCEAPMIICSMISTVNLYAVARDVHLVDLPPSPPEVRLEDNTLPSIREL